MRRALAVLLLAGCPGGGEVYIPPSDLAPAVNAVRADLGSWPSIVPNGVSRNTLPFASLQGAAWSEALRVINGVNAGISIAMLNGIAGGMALQGGGGVRVSEPESQDDVHVSWADGPYRFIVAYKEAPYPWRLELSNGGRLIAEGDTTGRFDADLDALRTVASEIMAERRVSYSHGADFDDLVVDGDASQRHLRSMTPRGASMTVATEVYSNAVAGAALERVALTVTMNNSLAGRSRAVITGGDVGDGQVTAVECWTPGPDLVYSADDGGLRPPFGSESACPVP